MTVDIGVWLNRRHSGSRNAHTPALRWLVDGTKGIGILGKAGREIRDGIFNYRTWGRGIGFPPVHSFLYLSVGSVDGSVKAGLG
jgi:hypothetical protein